MEDLKNYYIEGYREYVHGGPTKIKAAWIYGKMVASFRIYEE